MFEKKINSGKIKFNQRLMALALAGVCTFSLVGCKNFSKKNPQASIGVIRKLDNGYSYIEGAHVEIIDDNNNIVESWISDDKCYDIYGLNDGHYIINISYEQNNCYLTSELIIENGKQTNSFNFVLIDENSFDITNENDILKRTKKK